MKLITWSKVLASTTIFLGTAFFGQSRADDSSNLDACLRYGALGRTQAASFFNAARNGVSASQRCDIPALFEAYLRARDSGLRTPIQDPFLNQCFQRSLDFEAVALFNAESDKCQIGMKP